MSVSSGKWSEGHDVIILGAGLAGAVTGLCLARNGLRVLLIDDRGHPRFAIGESSTTPASLWLRLLADRFDVPELLSLVTHDSVARDVSASSGVKNNFGFHYHREGEPAPSRSWQAVIASAAGADSELHSHPRGGETHYFRQDVDAFMWRAALNGGVDGRVGARVENLSFDPDGVRVHLSTGEVLSCAFLIDASGIASPVARSLNLRDAVPSMRTNSRTMFTHMAGVAPYDDVTSVPRTLSPWHQGTLHHFFDGGWMWVIPFDNHPASTNRLCSVGLNIDNRRFPRETADPEREWSAFLGRFPSIAAQFENALPVRPWVQTERLQYSSQKCVGDRFWMTTHATAAVDALYSFGNINTFQAIAAAVPAILAAFEDRRFEVSRFEPLQRLNDNLFRFHDRVVYGSYQATRSPDLLATWLALWALTDTARIRELLIPMIRRVRSGDARELEFYDRDPANIFTGLGHCTGVEHCSQMLDRLDSWCDIMGELDGGQASIESVRERLDRSVQHESPFGVRLDVMEQSLGQLPWTYAPLSRAGLKGYGSVFLTGEELNRIGVDREPNRQQSLD
ncbi:MAG: FAD-dependent oxidoreductase [Planctomycetota bacterium]